MVLRIGIIGVTVLLIDVTPGILVILASAASRQIRVPHSKKPLQVNPTI